MRTSADLTDTNMPPLRNRSFRLLMVVTTGGFAGFTVLLPVVPLWAVVGGAGEIAAGATNATFMLATVLAQLGMPWLLRRADHRVVVGLGAVLIGIPAPFFLLSSDLVVLLGVSALRGIGFGLLTVAGAALVAELLPAAQRGRAAGIYGLAAGIPNVVFLPAGVWFTQQIGYGPVFFVAGALPVVAAAAVLGMSPVTPRDTPASGLPSVPVALLPPWAVMGAASVVAGGLVAFLPLALGGTVAPAALMAFGAAAMAGRWAAGQVGDRLGQRRVLVPSVVLAGLGAALLAAAAAGMPPLGLLGAVVFGAGFGAVQNTTLVVMFEHAESGLASTAWNIAYDSGQGVGAIGFGFLVTLSGYPAAFGIAAILVTICTPLAVIHRPRVR